LNEDAPAGLVRPLLIGGSSGSGSLRYAVDREVAEAIDGSFLGRLPRKLVDQLSQEGERLDYPPSTTFFREGSAPRALVVITGLIRIFMTSSQGRRVTVRYTRVSEILGIALAMGGPFHVSA
jgi:CRP/FNR family transcriptional regulator